MRYFGLYELFRLGGGCIVRSALANTSIGWGRWSGPRKVVVGTVNDKSMKRQEIYTKNAGTLEILKDIKGVLQVSVSNLYGQDRESYH